MNILEKKIQPPLILKNYFQTKESFTIKEFIEFINSDKDLKKWAEDIKKDLIEYFKSEYPIIKMFIK